MNISVSPKPTHKYSLTPQIHFSPRALAYVFLRWPIATAIYRAIVRAAVNCVIVRISGVWVKEYECVRIFESHF